MKPQNLTDALAILDGGVDDETKEYIKINNRAPHVMGGDDLGRAIRNNFRLWDEGSPLREYFRREFQLEHADDISWFIEEAFAARLRGEQTYDPGELLQKVRQHWLECGENQYVPTTTTPGKVKIAVN